MTETQIREQHLLLQIAVAADRVLRDQFLVPESIRQLMVALRTHRSAGFSFVCGACESLRPCGCDEQPAPDMTAPVTHDLF